MTKRSIPLYKPHIPADTGTVIEQVLRSGQLAGDGNIPEFEEALKQFIGAPRIVLTAEFSRTVEMALRMAGVERGDSVLVSPLACLATTVPILNAGGQPIWCDIDPATGGLRPDEILRKASSNCKAVLLYHWVGIPADVAGVTAAAAQLGLKVIEDAGEALGAEYDGKRIGAHGCDYSVFSFSPVRHITTIDGAAIAVRDEEQYALGRIWRRYGIPEVGFRDSLGELSRSCDITVAGCHNYMNRISGALGAAQMQVLPRLLEAHRNNGEFFDKHLDGVPGVKLLPVRAGVVPSYWVYCFLCENRDALLRKLREAGIYASCVHLRNDVYSCFGTTRPALPCVDDFERVQLCIPCGWWVSSEDREFIAATIRNGW
jgi:perosamine synthetase